MSKTVQIKPKSLTWVLMGAPLSGAAVLVAALLGTSRPAFRETLSTYADAQGAIVLEGLTFAQEGGDDEEPEIPPEQVEKYIAVYKAMQRDHGLNVEQAAAKQGLSLDAFRDIEGRIERDDLIRERVREALRGGTEPSAGKPSAASSPKPPAK